MVSLSPHIPYDTQQLQQHDLSISQHTSGYKCYPLCIVYCSHTVAIKNKRKRKEKRSWTAWAHLFYPMFIYKTESIGFNPPSCFNKVLLHFLTVQLFTEDNIQCCPVLQVYNNQDDAISEITLDWTAACASYSGGACQSAFSLQFSLILFIISTNIEGDLQLRCLICLLCKIN